jgi:hypothetical protein
VREPVPPAALERSPAGSPDRRVVMVASAEEEPSLADVVTNLATVCSEIGQRVALVSTAGLESPEPGPPLPQSSHSWWKQWPSHGRANGRAIEEERERLLSGPLDAADVEDRLGETGIPRVSRLDLRYFIGNPVQVVIRVPEVLAALLQVVDVVFLEVPSYLTVHYGQGLTPLADVVLVVAEREKTTLSDMRRVSAAFRHLGAPVVGMALTEGGLEVYDWGHEETELETGDDEAEDVRDPTQQLPISGPTGFGVAPTFDELDELSVVEPAPREA